MSIEETIAEAVIQRMDEQLDARLDAALRRVLPGVIRRASQPEFMSRSDAAEFLGVSQRKLDYLLREKKLPKTKRGRRVLVPTSALRAYLDEATVPSRAER